MSEIEVVIANRLGLHARAAARFVHVANKVDGKSILGLLTLAAKKGTRLRLSASGDDADAALAELSELVRTCFGEGE